MDRFGHPVGEVKRVLILETGELDGIVVKTHSGKRFVDAPEVRRISRGAVTLGVAAADVESPGGGGAHPYGIPEARHDRIDATEADRDEAIDCLKRAYVRDDLTTDQLADRVGAVHLAETLDQLDAAVSDVVSDE